MKIKRYNIEQLKKYSVVLSPAEQLMLLGGNRHEEGKYGVSLLDDNGNLISFVSYGEIAKITGIGDLILKELCANRSRTRFQNHLEQQ